jgi:hypothetical protein
MKFRTINKPKKKVRQVFSKPAKVIEAVEEDEIVEAVEEEAEYIEHTNIVEEEEPRKVEREKPAITVKRIQFADIEDSMVYGVLCNNPNAFGTSFRPAMGWEIKKAGYNQFEYGVVKAFLSNSKFWPKGTFVAHHSSWEEGTYIAMCYWKGPKYTPVIEGAKPKIRFARRLGKWAFLRKPFVPKPKPPVRKAPKPKIKFKKRPVVVKKKKLAFRRKRK